MAFTGTVMLSRLRVVKVKIESPMGTYTAPDQAGHVFDLKCEPTAKFIDRLGTGQYRGPQFAGSIGEKTGKCSFKTELKSTGTNGMELFCAILLQAAGFVKATEVYSLHSNHANDKTISIAVWEDGKKKMLKGCSATKMVITGKHGEPMYLECEFEGFWITAVDEAMPTWEPSTRLPMLFDGGAFTMATNAIKIMSFSLDLGLKTANRSGDYFMVTDFDPIIAIDPEEYKVADYDFHGNFESGTTAAVSMPVSDSADIITISCPKVQCKELTDNDLDGRKALSWTGQCQHSAGNDAVSLTVT